MQDYFIGADIGTGSVKALAVSNSGKVLSSAQVPYPTENPLEGRFEQDPETIWKAFQQCIAQTTRNLDRNPAGIGLSSAMHSLIVMNKEGNALSPMITWADNRASQIAQRIRNSASGEMLYEQNGTPIHAMSPFCKIVWLREHQPLLFEKAYKFISIKEYVWLKMFQVYEADHSIASASGLMDIEHLQWNTNALNLAGISIDQLSLLVRTDHVRNNMANAISEDMGIDSSTPVIIGATDGCMANLGSFAIDEGIAALTIGTSGAVRVASKKPVFNFDAQTFNYRLDNDTYICGGPTNNGGVVLKWYAESLLGKKLQSATDYQELLGKIKSTEPGAEDLLFLPFILGERAPIWNSEASGVFFGMRNHHTQAHFTRAVLEGVSMALYNISENMERCGLNITQLNVSGGFVHSTQWLQILADLFGKDIHLVNTSDASALGAAYMGMKKIGMITSYDELEGKESKVIQPDTKYFEVYQNQYKRYLDLYARLSDLMVYPR